MGRLRGEWEIRHGETGDIYMRMSLASNNRKCIPPECLGYRWRKGKMLGKDKYIDYSVGCGARVPSYDAENV